MKSKTLTWIIAITLFAALAIPVQLAGQGNHKSRKHHHYQVIDLGALGGKNSFIGNPATLDINRRGTTVAEADTSTPDPYAPNFFQQLFGECLVNHTLQWKDGSVTDLGALPGVNSSYPAWINRQGWIAGLSENGATDPLTGFPETDAVLWKEGQIISLGTLGGSTSWANQVNNRGQVVGVALNAIADPFAGTLHPNFFFFPVATQGHAFLWDGENGMQDLGTLDSGPDSAAFFVNESGQVAGISYTNSTPNTNNEPPCAPNVPTQDPFLWQKGKMKDLGTLGGHCGWPFALNNRGEVVGDSTPAGDVYMLPFLWTKARGMRRLPSVGGNFGEAYGINDAGQVVGWSSTKGDSGSHAVLWEKGMARDLGTVDGDVCAVAFSINLRGQLIGFSGGPSCTDRAFFWENDGPLIDLNSLVPPNSDLHLYEAISINDRAEIIGNGSLANGDVHAFLLIPCDENHPGVEGCDYSMVEVTAATGVGPAPADQHPAALTPGGRMPVGILNRFRFPLGKRSQSFGTVPASLQKQEPAFTVTDEREVDYFRCGPHGCRHYGYCEVDSSGKLDGLCTSHNYQFCDIQPSGNCPRGQKAKHETLESCGGFGSDRVDLATTCSF